MNSRKKGTVKWFDTEKGYGFIVNSEGEDVFVHYRSIIAKGFRNLTESQSVSFLQTKGDRGWQAEEVQVQLENESDQTNSKPAQEGNTDE